MVNNIIAHRKKETIYIPDILTNDITFLDKLIIIRKKNVLTVYSSKCPHLGCKINIKKNDEFICPCHGSRFDKEGNPINGPAVRNLKQLTIYKDVKNGKRFVYVS